MSNFVFFVFWPCVGHIWALYGSRGAIYGPSIPGTRPAISGAGRFWPVLTGSGRFCNGFEPKWSNLTPPTRAAGQDDGS